MHSLSTVIHLYPLISRITLQIPTQIVFFSIKFVEKRVGEDVWRGEKMAEPLKNMYSRPLLEDLATRISAKDDHFDKVRFIEAIFSGQWESLSLKERMRKITLALGQTLPKDYRKALCILQSLGNDAQKGLFVLFPDFVEVYGLEHWEESIQALEYFTKGSSSEFAVRPFIKKDPDRMMEQMKRWATDKDEHVRRLASEGCRPRLPWGEALTDFKRDPSPVLEVLELLKKDPSKYVRKSVANNLNDLSKDHPAIVLAIANRWKGQHEYTDWIIRHGCRGLLRLDVPEAYALFNYVNSTELAHILENAHLEASANNIKIGDSVTLSWDVAIKEPVKGRIRFEYAIDFMKANGKSSRKKFLLLDRAFSEKETLTRHRMHHFADLSTRKHYPGDHTVSLLANGVTLAQTTITVTE